MRPTLFPPNWATLNLRAKWRYVRRLQRLQNRGLEAVHAATR